MSASVIDPLWIAFGAFGFGCAVVAFTVGCWVRRGVGRVETRRVHGAEDRPNSVVRRPPSPPTGKSERDAA